MSSQNASIIRPQRWKKREKHFSKLLSNIQVDHESNKVSFAIKNCSQYLTWQRKPFYDITTIDFYMYTLLSFIIKLLDNNKRNKLLLQQQIAALIGEEIKLYSLNASHPNFGTYQNHEKQIKNGRTLYISEMYLYQKNESLTLLAYIKSTGIYLDAKRSAAISQTRISKQQYMKSSKMNNFPFCAPSMIGDCNEKCVFLSDLKIKHNKIYCDGLINLENGFDSHPWAAGTGDHINSNHVVGSSMQFIYLLIRNCKYDKFDKKILKNNNTKILKQYNQAHLVIFNADIEYKKFIELGQYQVELMDLSLMDDTEVNQSSVGKENVLFGFKVQLNIKQNDTVCINATYSVCPLYLIANL